MFKLDWSKWSSLVDQEPVEFKCGYCGAHVGTHRGFYHKDHHSYRVYVCTNCGRPTFFGDSTQTPGSLLGRNIGKLPENVERLYIEINKAIQNGLHTSAILSGRKLIMHLAVDVAGAEPGLNFVDYISHIKDSGYIPPNGEQLLEYIRTLGNQNNHEIIFADEDQANKLHKFIESLLIFMYELPSEFNDEEN